MHCTKCGEKIKEQDALILNEEAYCDYCAQCEFVDYMMGI